MYFRRKRIAVAETDHTYALLPPAQITVFHPLDFPENLLLKRPFWTVWQRRRLETKSQKSPQITIIRDSAPKLRSRLRHSR